MGILMSEPEHYIKYFIRGELWFIKALLHEEDLIDLFDYLTDIGGLITKSNEAQYYQKLKDQETGIPGDEKIFDIEGDTELHDFIKIHLVK
jgi:hypothetical protein